MNDLVDPRLEIRQTAEKGRGVFARFPIAGGELIAEIQGWRARTEELHENWFAMQIGPDLWLCSDGEGLDDCINHSCDPNVGFITGEPVLHALRAIVAGEEIAWDYSTSISEKGWCLECRCGTPKCRRRVVSWGELAEAEREGLRPISLGYLRDG